MGLYLSDFPAMQGTHVKPKVKNETRYGEQALRAAAFVHNFWMLEAGLYSLQGNSFEFTNIDHHK